MFKGGWTLRITIICTTFHSLPPTNFTILIVTIALSLLKQMQENNTRILITVTLTVFYIVYFFIYAFLSFCIAQFVISTL